MLISAAMVKKACEKDTQGMLDPRHRVEEADADSDADEHAGDPDDDHATVIDEDDDDDPVSDTESVEDDDRAAGHGLLPGQQRDSSGGRVRGKHTGVPLKFKPRPLPPLPLLPSLLIHHADGSQEVVPWTNRYKYLGFVLRSDLMDDDAYGRVETKTRIAAERLFPHHRLVRSFPLGHKIQLLQTIVLSVSGNVMPLLTSMRTPTELKTTRLDNMRKRVAKEVVRLHHSARREYVVAEAALGDVHGEVTMHRVRLQESLQKHPLASHDTPLNQQPFASRMLRIMQAESANIKLTGPQRTHLLLCPWPLITNRIAADSISKHAAQGWQQPAQRWEIAPYASTVSRIGAASVSVKGGCRICVRRTLSLW